MRYFLAVIFLAICFVQAESQTVALAGAKTLTGSATSLQIAPFDTIASALRYMQRTGPWYSQRQLDSVKALGGITLLDSTRIWRLGEAAGMKVPPTRIILAPSDWTPGATYIKQ